VKPLKLTMQAFGPYADKEEIDFRNLGNRTMFVISGKTGSGKTTIFDGISFSIYGKASGEDRSPAELRSQFAKDEDITEVELLFSLRGKTYRIWRSPQQEKKKARGEGFTTINARAELYTFDEDGAEQLLAANVREVDEKIKSLIQLDANQFRQILMIPQGEFRKLLTSDSKDKEVILQRLFHTELYKVIQEGLKTEADELRKTVEAAVETRTRELLKINTENNDELIESLKEEPLNDSRILGLLPAHIEKMEEQQINVQLSYQQVQNKRDSVNKQLAEANTLLQQFELRDKLTVEFNKLEQQTAEMEKVKNEIALAHKASRLIKQDEYCHKLNQKLKVLKRELEQLLKDQGTLAEKLKQAKNMLSEEAEREPVRDTLVKKINHLESIQKDVYSLDTLQSDLNEIQEQRSKEQQLIDKQSEQITFLQRGIRERENALEKFEESQSMLFQFEKTLQDKESLLETLKEARKLIDRNGQYKKNFTSLNEQYTIICRNVKDAADTVAYLDNQWRTAQAAILASDLDKETPCPVCGSLHHPQLAMGGHDLPSDEDMESAKKTLQSLQDEEKKVSLAAAQEETKMEETEGQIHSLLKKASKFSKDLTIENSVNVIQEAEDSVRSVKNLILEKKKEVDQQTRTKEELKKGKEKLLGIEEAVKDRQLKQQQLEVAYLTKKTALEKVRESIPNEITTKNDFDNALKQKQDLLGKMKSDFEKAQQNYFTWEKENSVKASQVEEKKNQADKIDAEMKEEREAFLSLLTQQGFPHYKSFHEAKKTEDEIIDLENKLKKYGEDLRSVTDRLDEVNRQLEDQEKPDIKVIKEVLAAVSEEMEKVNQELNRVISHTKENKNILSRVLEINEGIKELEVDYQTVGQLADLARGQNANRLTFERYVLASFLEDILSIANERLIKMTAGRYNLIRKADRSKGNVQSGLELLVFDQYTGQDRHVKTLSGGESFKASLALALGLADVVQQYAGGVSLETMFIDEGFGTLDPESLDHAIEALMDIQSSGRLVGLISHVPELKERIDARLEVISSQNGSRTEFLFTV
jgi:DNA repair protein SbcC/Rad50